MEEKDIKQILKELSNFNESDLSDSESIEKFKNYLHMLLTSEDGIAKLFIPKLISSIKNISSELGVYDKPEETPNEQKMTQDDFDKQKFENYINNANNIIY